MVIYTRSFGMKVMLDTITLHIINQYRPVRFLHVQINVPKLCHPACFKQESMINEPLRYLIKESGYEKVTHAKT